MVDELRGLGVELMVSIWPTVNPASENYAEMDRRGLLVGNVGAFPFTSRSGTRATTARPSCAITTPPTPRPASYIWAKVTEGYRRYGIRAFWLDACEPEMRPEDPESALYYLGRGMEVQNALPQASTLAALPRGSWADGENDVLLLCRSAWAGSQRYGAAVWSGDIDSTFEALAAQIPAGLNIGISGIPWWTTDIGGFKGGDPSSAVLQGADRALVPVRRLLPAVQAPRGARTGPAGRLGPDRGPKRGLVLRRRGVRHHPRAARATRAIAPVRDGPDGHRQCHRACRPCVRCSWSSPTKRRRGRYATSSCSARTCWLPRSPRYGRASGTFTCPRGRRGWTPGPGTLSGQRLGHGRGASGTHTRVPTAGRCLEQPCPPAVNSQERRAAGIRRLAREEPTWLGQT